MKRTATAMLATSIAVTGAMSATAGTVVKTARVISSTPVVETAYEPYETCTTQLRKADPYAKRNDTINQVVGGLVGGAAGSAAGKGSGRDAAAAVGAVIGSEVLNPDNEGLGQGEIVGAVVGGLVGNNVGKGSGKTAATATGALIGKIVGGNIENPETATSKDGYKRVSVCKTHEREKKIITGYTVKYSYGGNIFTDVLDHDPGSEVKIAVDVAVIE